MLTTLLIDVALAAVVLFNGVSGTPTTCTRTNVTFWWSLETQDFTATNGSDDYSAGDTSGELFGDLIRIDTNGNKLGTNGINVPANTGEEYYSFDVSGDDIASEVSGRVGLWFKRAAGTWPGANPRIITLFGASSDNIYIASSAATGSLSLTYRGASTNTTVTTPPSVIANDTWHYLEAEWDTAPAAGSDVLRLWVDGTLKAGSSSESITDFTTDPSNISLVSVLVGNASPTPWGTRTYIDQVIVTSDHTQNLYLCSAEEVYQSSTTNLFDDFSTDPFISRWDKDTGETNWTWESQSIKDSSTGVWDVARATNIVSASSTVWVKVKLVSFASGMYVGSFARSTASSTSSRYFFSVNTGSSPQRVYWFTAVWDTSAFVVTQVSRTEDCTGWVEGDTLGVVISGTGASTTVKFSRNPTGVYTSWVQCGSLLDADPSPAIDSGTSVGVATNTENVAPYYIVLDDFDAGGL